MRQYRNANTFFSRTQATLIDITDNVKSIITRSSPNNFIKNVHDVTVSVISYILNKTSINLISKDSLKWYTNYALFGLEIRWIKTVLPSLGSSILPNSISSHAAGAIVGAIVQGNSECGWQVKLASTSPTLGALVGGIHGAICCAVISSAMDTFESLAPAEYKIPARMLGFVATTSLASHIMCFNEKFVYNWHEKGFKYAVSEAGNHLLGNTESFVQKLERVQSKPCCHCK
ncbi:MAG: hypothetical protein AB8U25_02560 [Rickettsiales endosymbiont of Dermacentor nuttalli]